MTTAQRGEGEAKVGEICYWHGTTALSAGQLYKALGGLYISMWGQHCVWTVALGNGKEHWTWGIATLGMCSKAAMGWNNYELGAEVLRGGTAQGEGQQHWFGTTG